MQHVERMFVSGDGASVLGYVVLALVMFAVVCVQHVWDVKRRRLGQRFPASADFTELGYPRNRWTEFEA